MKQSMHCSADSHTVAVAARPSPLSQAQVQEVWEELRRYHPGVSFLLHTLWTEGDLDKETSLREREQSDFFTGAIDRWVAACPGRVGIHSAKDLPHPLPEGLALFCLTAGRDPADVVVLPEGVDWETLLPASRIATSSHRRERLLLNLRPDLVCRDIRGTIEERLAQLDRGEIEGVVMAEAALLRLGFHHRNRFRLPGETAPGQGRLAVIGRQDDTWLASLFACLHVSS